MSTGGDAIYQIIGPAPTRCATYPGCAYYPECIVNAEREFCAVAAEGLTGSGESKRQEVPVQAGTEPAGLAIVCVYCSQPLQEVCYACKQPRSVTRDELIDLARKRIEGAAINCLSCGATNRVGVITTLRLTGDDLKTAHPASY